MTAVYTYFVSGKVYVREYGAADAFEFPGLVDSLELGITEQVISLPDRTQVGGGNYDDVRRVQSMSMTINHREFKPSVLARALFGTSSDVSGAAVVSEAHDAYLDRFIPLEHPGPYTLLTITDDATSPGAVDAANYEVRPAGLYIPADAPDLIDGDGIQVSYTHPAYTRIQALTTSPPLLEFFFEGLNEADGGNPRPAKFHRVRLGAAAAMALLSGDDFGELSLTGEVLKDQTITTTGLSQYFYGDIVTDIA
jgi:hypothetical protein